MPRSFAAAALLAALAPLASAAAEPAEANAPGTAVIGAEPSNWSLGIALGYGMRSNPLIQSDDIPILVDLDIAWFGERFFFDNGDVGLTVHDGELFTFNLVGRFNSDRVFFGRTDTRIVRLANTTGQLVEVEVRPPDRDYAGEAGAELLAGGDWGRLQVAAFHDVGGTHRGYEVAADYGYGFRRQRWYFEPGIGVSFKSRRLNDYYWGVQEDEANAALPAYAAGAGANLSLRLLGSYQLTPNWAAAVVLEYERLGGEIAGSPIVRDEYVTGFFAGVGYRF